MVLNVHRNHRVYYGRGEGGEGGMEVGGGGRGGGGERREEEERDYIPIATLTLLE